MNKTSSAFFRGLTSAEKDAVAKHCGINRLYLNNLIYSRDRDPSPVLAAKIEKATGGRIKRETLRPDLDWNLIRGSYV